MPCNREVVGLNSDRVLDFSFLFISVMCLLTDPVWMCSVAVFPYKKGYLDVGKTSLIIPKQPLSRISKKVFVLI